MAERISFVVNGTPRALDVEPKRLLAIKSCTLLAVYTRRAIEAAFARLG